MKELQRRQQMKRVLYSYPSLSVLVLICFFLVKGAFGVMLKERESARKVNELEGQALALESREAELLGEIARLKTEEGIMEEIKDKFSVTREGEFVAIIVDDRRATSTDPTGLSWFERLWRVIMPK